LLTESCTVICQLVMLWSSWMSPACCDMSGLLAVAVCPDCGWSCNSVSPICEALAFWTQWQMVLLLTRQLPYIAHNHLWMFPHFLFLLQWISYSRYVTCVRHRCHFHTLLQWHYLSDDHVLNVHNNHQCCYPSIFTLLSLFWNEKKTVGHYLLGDPLIFKTLQFVTNLLWWNHTHFIKIWLQVCFHHWLEVLIIFGNVWWKWCHILTALSPIYLPAFYPMIQYYGLCVSYVTNHHGFDGVCHVHNFFTFIPKVWSVLCEKFMYLCSLPIVLVQFSSFRAINCWTPWVSNKVLDKELA
jgi:hypothetical protein